MHESKLHKNANRKNCKSPTCKNGTIAHVLFVIMLHSFLMVWPLCFIVLLVVDHVVGVVHVIDVVGVLDVPAVLGR